VAVTLIVAFEVPPEADDAFIAAWERNAYQAAALHRALRDDVAFRFVNVALVDSQEDWEGAELAFRATPGLYEVVREDGTPDVEGGVVLINPFEVPADRDERFLAGWDRARDVLAQRRGYLGTRLHRSIGPAHFRFVDIARWSSPLMFARARADPDFGEPLPFPSHPALYQVVRG